MKKNEFVRIAKIVWDYGETLGEEECALIKELILKINRNEAIIDEEVCKIDGSNGNAEHNTTKVFSFQRST